jgi:hypothetical protein
MNANGKSDEPVVPTTSANNDATGASAESAEERGSTEKNAQQDAQSRTQDRKQHRSGGLHGVRSCPQGQPAQIHELVASCERRLLTEAFFNLEENGGGWSMV